MNKIFCPGYGTSASLSTERSRSMVIILASLADSICRHPDVTLESGLVPHTIRDL